VRAAWVASAVAVAVFAVAYADGGYSLASRSTLALAVWWAILLGVALGVWPLGRLAGAAAIPGALLAAFAAWDLASTAWAASAEDAFAEFDRTALYLGVYVLVVLAADPRRLGPWLDGLALAIGAVSVVALVSRLFPGSFPARGLPEFLPNATTRLSFPLDYWNGLGAFVALAFPLLLRSALAGVRLRRVVAVGAMPALGAVVYLTSSRGAVAAAALGTAVFVVAQPRRWPAVGAAVAGAVGSAVAVGLLSTRHALVNGPLGSDAARREGWEAAIALAIVCVATAAAFELAAPRLPAPGRWARRIGLAAVAVVVVAGIAVAASRVGDFTRTPTTSGTVGQHLVSGGGSGRWQFWTAAVHEFESSPLGGRGAGSFANWWNQHASFTYTVRNAHSLYLETLGELGIVGFALLVGALGAGVAVGVRRLHRTRGDDRTATAALLGTLAAYLLAAGIDWMWELPAVTLVAMVALGLLAGGGEPAPRPHHGLGAALAVAAAAILVAETIPLLADVEVRRSQAEARAGNLARARVHAIAATRLEPWAGSPYLQLALVEEKANRLADAAVAIHRATSRDADNWQPWYVAAGIEGRLGQQALARASLLRARALDPRSPLFSGTP
jgi:hypothetical protein